jgi:uncharacterized protein
MKRLSIILLIVLLFLNCLPVLALDTDIKVYDEADLFSDNEEKELQKAAQALAEKTKIDIVIVTILDAEGKTSEAYADDFYDYNGFGIDKDNSGILLLIDMDNRNVWISTTGKCIRIFPDDRIDDILDGIVPFLSEAAYADGAKYFLDSAEYYIGQGIPSDQYNYDRDTGEISQYSDTPEYKMEQALRRLPLFVLIGLGIGGGVVGIMAINNKGVKTTDAGTYLDSNSFNLIDNRDIYIRTAVTKRLIESDSGGSSGGGGSRSTTHSGSSGSSHGGGGRGF